eukprot:TRINITY_DN1493_c1_g4_i1.p1 TRINITY_DN1493_c1_g4~~TRINITY_DN1493_c1_g4_i1.p1  ORF type:complete len:265 (+),score=53.33 TRINITY_DN1493_c1_g4_i1:318-1112(+)
MQKREYFVTNVFTFEQTGMTALHLACRHGANADCVRVILGNNLIEDLCLMTNEANRTPLHIAACYSSPEVVELILNYSNNLRSSLESANHVKAMMCASDKHHRTPLHMCLLSKPSPQMISAFLLPRQSLSPFYDMWIKLLSSKDTDGNTPIHLLAQLPNFPITLWKQLWMNIGGNKEKWKELWMIGKRKKNAKSPSRTALHSLIKKPKNGNIFEFLVLSLIFVLDYDEHERLFMKHMLESLSSDALLWGNIGDWMQIAESSSSE